MFHHVVSYRRSLVLILCTILFLETQADSDICKICTCNSLTTNINCAHRNLPSIPQPIPTNVEYLYLGSNNIATIKEGTFTGLSNLNYLALWGNSISTINEGTLTGLSNLKGLDLGGNNIATIKEGAFTGLSNLKTLGLGNNKISRIEKEMFQGLQNLEMLFLDNNKISRIEKEMFQGLQNLEELYLYENNISTIKEGTFTGLSNLKELYIDGINVTVKTSSSNGNVETERNLMESIQQVANSIHQSIKTSSSNEKPSEEASIKRIGGLVNPRDGRGQTPLHVACSRRSLHTVELLLGHNGIDANVVDNDGDTPMHEAVRGQRYNIVSKMLIQGSLQLDIKNKKERTPLLEAVSQSHLGMTHLLIALGADINAVDGEGNSCLHLAVNRNVFDSEDAPLDLLNECCTALNLKLEERLSGIVVARYLASQGADFHHKNNKNNTPLDLIKDPNLRKKNRSIFTTTMFVVQK
ncbi:E3 ubiquitin-protein ligase MIB2-like [Octopus vulgaris]|uniref:E3 ubiquitin-protein ligase MIB2-like n=1 Tax=Octopus vulgaris TaxID=6645 RepID=A0AA36MIN8_OCTVU|nr:E3 ubiquitin-protein ligase MIB2-like [Octopus vulgaris]